MALINCSECGRQVSSKAWSCPQCGMPISPPQVVRSSSSPPNPVAVSKSKGLAVGLAMILGGFGFHKFYMDRPGWGVLYLFFCWTFIPSIIAFFEGLSLIFMDDHQFQILASSVLREREWAKEFGRIQKTSLVNAQHAHTINQQPKPFAFVKNEAVERALEKPESFLLISVFVLVAIFFTLGVLFSTNESEQGNSPIGTGSAAIFQMPSDDPSYTYSVTESQRLPGIKRSLDVRLSQRITEDQLRALALKLKNAESSNFKRTFISYRVPTTDKLGIAWAVTHFDPDLYMKIQGLTVKQEEALKEEAFDSSMQIIGSWIDETGAGLPCIVTIYQSHGRIFRKDTSPGGGSFERELARETSNNVERYRLKSGDHPGDYQTIDSNGNLQKWDADGLLSTHYPTEIAIPGYKRRLVSKEKSVPPTKPMTTIDLRPASGSSAESVRTSIVDSKEADAAEAKRNEEIDISNQKLRIADRLIRQGNRDLARYWYVYIVDNWPETLAANEARVKLQKIYGIRK